MQVAVSYELSFIKSVVFATVFYSFVGIVV